MAKDPEESASSSGRKAGQTLPMIRQMLGKLKDNGRTVNGMINNGMTGPGMGPKKLGQPRQVWERQWKGRKVRFQGSKDGSAQLADSAQGGTTTATTFFVDHFDPVNFSFMATEEEKTSFIAQPLTPTSMVLDLGCTRAMASRVAAQDLMKFCDHNPDCGIWYHIAETTSQFTFANSESTKCNQKLVVCMYDKEYVVQSTEFDIVEQGHVPILMSLPQMRNLRFQFELHPDKALLSSPVLGIWDVKLKVAPSSHLVLDLLDLSRFLWNVRFDKHKKSSFLTSNMGAIRRLREALHRKRYPMSSPLRLMTSGWSMKLTWS